MVVALVGVTGLSALGTASHAAIASAVDDESTRSRAPVAVQAGGSNVLGKLIREARQLGARTERAADLFSTDLLHPGLRPFPEPGVLEDGIPGFLARSQFETGWAFDFGGGEGLDGSGVLLGDGYVATARHVAQLWLDRAEREATGWFVGEARFNRFPEWKLRVMPDPGSYRHSTTLGMEPQDYGRWRDLALVRSNVRDRSDLRGIRPTRDLTIGERVWVLGKKEGAQTKVATGTLVDVTGDNARFTDITVIPGFSGGPVLDANGFLVGISVVREASGDLVTVNTEVLLQMLKRAQRSRQVTRVLTTASH